MTPRPLPEVPAAAHEVLSALDADGIRACVIGALAVHRWGEPRATSDADYLSDVEGIVRRQGRRLDVDLIRRWGREFAELKKDPDLLRPFEDALREATGQA